MKIYIHIIGFIFAGFLFGGCAEHIQNATETLGKISDSTQTISKSAKDVSSSVNNLKK